MFVPKTLIDWITTVKLDEAPKLREENAALRAERDTLKLELAKSHFTQDWFRMQINTLQLERTALLNKAYSINVPAPELIQARVLPREDEPKIPTAMDFEDMGDSLAKKLGLPTYSEQ